MSKSLRGRLAVCYVAFAQGRCESDKKVAKTKVAHFIADRDTARRRRD